MRSGGATPACTRTPPSPEYPDPVSGMHYWHQAVRVRPATSQDQRGDIAVDTAKARTVYQEWLRLTRPAGPASPAGLHARRGSCARSSPPPAPTGCPPRDRQRSILRTEEDLYVQPCRL